MGRKLGAVPPFFFGGGDLGPHLAQCDVLYYFHHYHCRHHHHIITSHEEDAGRPQPFCIRERLYHTTFLFVNKITCLQHYGTLLHAYLLCDHTVLLQSHLEYANSVCYPNRNKTGVDKLEKRATKLIPEMSKRSYSDRLKALNLPMLKYRRYR